MPQQSVDSLTRAASLSDRMYSCVTLLPWSAVCCSAWHSIRTCVTLLPLQVGSSTASLAFERVAEKHNLKLCLRGSELQGSRPCTVSSQRLRETEEPGLAETG